MENSSSDGYACMHTYETRCQSNRKGLTREFFTGITVLGDKGLGSGSGSHVHEKSLPCVTQGQVTASLRQFFFSLSKMEIIYFKELLWRLNKIMRVGYAPQISDYHTTFVGEFFLQRNAIVSPARPHSRGPGVPRKML